MSIQNFAVRSLRDRAEVILFDMCLFNNKMHKITRYKTVACWCEKYSYEKYTKFRGKKKPLIAEH